jgi:arylformamidase
MSGKMIDVTVPLSAELPVWPGDPAFRLEFTRRMADGQDCNLSRMSLGSHAGTHVDAPFHFVAGGTTVDELPLEILIGKARVVSIPVRDAIGREHLETLDLRDDIRLLIKTRNSGSLRQAAFHEDYVHLTPDAASYLAQAGLKLVGIDYLSVDPHPTADHPAHHVLLEAGVVVVEGLDLSQVEPGEYDMTCLPLRVAGADGAPARVVLKPRI